MKIGGREVKKKLIILVIVGLLSCLMSGCENQNGSEADQSTTKSAAAPSSVYWSTYSNILGPPDSLIKLGGKGPYYINKVSITEASVEEELAMVFFSKDETSANDINEIDNSKYWFEITKNEEGTPVSVKVSSNAANDFVVTLYFNFIENDSPAYFHMIRSDDGVHSPDGAVIHDPYQDPELPIAGVKELNFKCGHEDSEKINNFLEEAGFDKYGSSYQNGIHTYSTRKELVSRAKIEETVLKPKDWTSDKDKAKGNVGFYNKSDSFTGNITIDYTLSNIPFTVEMKDVKLEKIEDLENQTSYTMSGTAEIKQESFAIADEVYRLKDEQKKKFSADNEFDFIVMKEPNPAVWWTYAETWEYVGDKYGAPFSVLVYYTTLDSPTDSSGVPVKDLDEIDGTDTFTTPGYRCTATWSFKAE